MPDNEDNEEPKTFEAWRSKLPRVTVDGVGFFVLHGDELRDEEEIRTIWEQRHVSRDAEHGPQSDQPIRFFDVSPGAPAGEVEPPRSKPTENNP